MAEGKTSKTENKKELTEEQAQKLEAAIEHDSVAEHYDLDILDAVQALKIDAKLKVDFLTMKIRDLEREIYS